ncbi:AGE family epimerase/isomerase [Mesorhizobium sp. BR1-1-16]|uniref:AGE family epimerase/isomerase n=1 Tax=Mesorhizobium sp. BR1-1-16 TaxID=2876653 RepID=UPI001CCBCFBE|nr:AGE family epimerase/isomerase [Mesorhizobium sp. BR1-1-16]MBZ9935213.1 AGE family epimerase/isomerase [Mesorhizobium sp. BR1-1-16]
MPNNAKPLWTGTTGPRFVDRAAHRHWLLGQASSLFDFFQFASFNPKGGFFTLTDEGLPNPPKPGNAGVVRELHDTTRMVHCSAVAHLLGLPGADRNVDHGMDFIWKRHRDTVNGGYFWGVDDEKATNPNKQAYGHAFVILAASSAKVIGHPDADRLMSDILEVLQTRFWDKAAGATTEEYRADWSVISDYRGQNSNMHLTEALMAAFEATGDRQLLSMAERIADLIINRHAREQGWRVAEHFTGDWTVDRDYLGDPMFRPRGTTPGHALEWSRLLVQLWELGGRTHTWMLDAARNLFLKTVGTGWNNTTGGFYYTLGWDDQPDCSDLYWWPCAEGIAAAAVLGSVDGDPEFEEWYRRIWGFVSNHIIDRKHGGWIPELDADLKQVNRVFTGRPDIYHAVQACLIPLLPPNGSITRGLDGNGSVSLLNGR